MQLQLVENFLCRLVCVLGDNLGSHWLGGFCTNFSNAHYVCRYCLVERGEGADCLRTTAAIRTPENYREAVSLLSENVKSYKGICSDFILNELSYFHVCLPGLPPCLGHDLFEGVV